MKQFIFNHPYIAGIFAPPFLYCIGLLFSISMMGVTSIDLLFVVPIITFLLITVFHIYVVITVDKSKVIILFFLFTYVCFILLLYFVAFKAILMPVNFGAGD